MSRTFLTGAAIAMAATTAMIASFACAAPVTIDFDDNPATGGPIAKDRYAALGVRMSLATAPGLFGGGELTASPAAVGLPAPAGGRGIVPYANLAGFLDDFLFDFATPITSFSLHAFQGAQAVRAEGYRAGVLVGEFSVPVEPGRLAVELTLGTPGGSMRFDRVVVRPTLGPPPTTIEGPMFYDVLSFSPVPAPGTAGLIFAGVLAAARRRR